MGWNPWVEEKNSVREGLRAIEDLSFNPLGLKILMQIFRLIAIHFLKE